MGEQVSYSISEAEVGVTTGTPLYYYEKNAFDKILKSNCTKFSKTKLFTEMARFNTLYMISKAGSGHIGSSFSSLDIISYLYLNVLNENDKFYSSKGHDSPGLYSVQLALGIIPFDKIHSLRKLNGLPGHPVATMKGAHTNTGSLGMGISKAKGFLKSNELLNKKGRIFVMTGDGELQEGQIWESLIKVDLNNKSNLNVIVDHNKVQSDTYVKQVSDLGNLNKKFESFDCSVSEGDGHDLNFIDNFVMKTCDSPKVMIAHTIKGKGVSFMEHTSMVKNQEYYKYHSGAPSAEEYKIASEEILEKITVLSESINLDLPKPKKTFIQKNILPKNTEKMIEGYSKSIVMQAKSNKNLVALDADLILDTGLIPFKDQFKDRYFQCGISEQDMVSQAGTMALSGLLPLVHSFSCFLTSRPSEQIYNNCLQGSKVIYIGSLSGLFPAGPGSSHQAVNDITSMAAMTEIKLMEPLNSLQLNYLLDYSINKTSHSSYLRLTSIPYNLIETKNDDYKHEGRGSVLNNGKKITIISVGPIMTSYATEVVEMFKNNNIDIQLITTPWLNSFDSNWYRENLKDSEYIITIENHYLSYGFGSYFTSQLALNNILNDKKIKTIGLEGKPNCGTNEEVAMSHELDPLSIYDNIINFVK
ncbi:hypothetical protein OAO69_00460 [Flavobacteriaceae bacterium]|nr:hypothetical protein [Flavobacteriaceae bacterium]